ncbi:VOC family protein [Mucilaginibacter psychrotolerans]|uniref:VOC family protein n=1 Tax=Mucilaginibacter psychrotolerans TaxID=1524096 RepID=A0A4Y8SPA9_9SPHI|nr:VOC family protein [Mucilaginibacter psychrotolerans]TFF40899.1 VOC family protein [Mucilaginibacter psychrotolerans]
MKQATNLKINAIQHIGIPVTDIANSQAFYERLGFANVMQAGFGAEDARGTCVMMKRDSMILELYQLPESELAEIKARGNGHIDHVAFDVSDIDETYAIIKQAGFGIIESEPVLLQFWTRGCKYFNITGPDGERLEFNQVL